MKSVLYICSPLPQSVVARRKSQRRLLFASVLLGVLASIPPCPAFANPTGGTVAAGNANISSSGTTLTVNQLSNSAVIDWRGFDIAQGETTNFVQPSSNSITLNRINSPSASIIDGALNANGNIVIVNQNGVLFGKTAHVNVNSLLVTTADIDNDQFMVGNYAFNKPGKPSACRRSAGCLPPPSSACTRPRRTFRTQCRTIRWTLPEKRVCMPENAKETNTCKRNSYYRVSRLWLPCQRRS